VQTILTATAINAAIKAAATDEKVKPINDPATPGLNLRVGKKRVTWNWLGRDGQGRVRRFTLGHWPHLGLADARRLARAMSHNAPRGADPVAEARARRAGLKAPKGHTLAGLLDLYSKQVGKDVKSWAPQMEPQIRRVFRAHLDTPLVNLSVGALQMTVDGYAKPKSASQGLRCLMPVLRWATAPGRGYVDRSLLDLRASAKKPTRDRVLSRHELAKLLPVLRVSDSPYASALRMILLTATRRSEVASARWRDVDLGARIWTLPETKNGEPHEVPLSRQAVALLRSLRSVDRDPAGFVFTTTSGRPLHDWETATRRLQGESTTAAWTRHDLRRTAATMMGKLGVMPDVIEAALNHVTIHSQIATVYNKSRCRPQVAEALQKLADWLDSIEQSTAEVIVLPVQQADAR
jgi:integrase